MRDWPFAALVLLFVATFAAALVVWGAQDTSSGAVDITSQAVDDDRLALAAVEINLSEGWTVSQGQRVLVPDDLYAIHERGHLLEVPAYVRTSDADSALAVEGPSGSGQLVVAYGNHVEIELPGPRNGTAASMDVHLSASSTTVELTQKRCQVQVGHAESQHRSNVFVLDEPDETLTAHLSGPGEGCPTGQLTVRNLGSGWSWSTDSG